MDESKNLAYNGPEDKEEYEEEVIEEYDGENWFEDVGEEYTGDEFDFSSEDGEEAALEGDSDEFDFSDLSKEEIDKIMRELDEEDDGIITID